MDAKQFLSEFGHVAHAPGGVARLRELIYQLAVTGRLTSQDEKDSDADEVLNNVARIRQQLIAAKNISAHQNWSHQILLHQPLISPQLALEPITRSW